MEKSVGGIHHVTAITDDPQRNIDFYSGLLGLRFVKKTVNFDSPDTYHFYYGDDLGRPGTILTFFSWPGAPRGRRGAGQVTATAFSIPEKALPYWQERLSQHNISFEGPFPRFDEQVLAFTAHDGLALELVAHSSADQGSAWTEGPVPVEYAICGFHSVTLAAARFTASETVLTELLGYQKIAQEGGRTRYSVGDGLASKVDIVNSATSHRGQEAVGSVHHVAWRTANDDNQLQWLQSLTEAGLQVTPVQDRNYFHSIYFREPSGILFEIATDSPGFAIDEDPAELGTHLKLPSWFEPKREIIERLLTPVHLPAIRQGK